MKAQYMTYVQVNSLSVMGGDRFQGCGALTYPLFGLVMQESSNAGNNASYKQTINVYIPGAEVFRGC